MTCSCGGEVPLPANKIDITRCQGCNKAYICTADHGWWGYTAEIWVPKPAKEPQKQEKPDDESGSGL